MKEVKIVKTLFEKGDVLVMGYKTDIDECEWICELAEEVCEDEIIDNKVEHVFGFYFEIGNAHLSKKITFVGGFCETQQYFRKPTTEELVEFYKTKADYYQEKAKKLAQALA